MPLLSHEHILEVHKAAMEANLAGARDALLAGMPDSFRASLPSVPDPNQQILSDLDLMNRAGRLVKGQVPLRIWLGNAIASAGERVQIEDFERARRAVDGAIVGRRAMAWVWVPVVAAALAVLGLWISGWLRSSAVPPVTAAAVVVPSPPSPTAVPLPTATASAAPVTSTAALPIPPTSRGTAPSSTSGSQKRLSGTAACTGSSCKLTTAGGTFDGAVHVCLEAEAGGERATCMVDGDPHGTRTATCTRSGRASGVALNGTYAWSECGR